MALGVGDTLQLALSAPEALTADGVHGRVVKSPPRDIATLAQRRQRELSRST